MQFLLAFSPDLPEQEAKTFFFSGGWEKVSLSFYLPPARYHCHATMLSKSLDHFPA